VSPIPSLPTDNLYKFCAVAGGLAILVSALMAFQGWRDVLGQQASLRNRAREYESQKLDIDLAESFSKPWWIPDGGDTPEAAAKKKEMLEEAKRLKPAVDEEGKRLATDWDKLNVAKYDFEIIGIATAVGMLFGFSLASYGFYNWRKLQLKQDQLLELELKQVRSKAHPKA
jgi:hypothetical protein